MLDGFDWFVAQHEATPPFFRAALQEACREHGKACGVWESAPDYGSINTRAQEGWDFYLGQVEGPGQYDRVQQSVKDFRADHPTFKAGVVTNFGGLDSARLAAPLIAAGYACIVETHIRENPNATPAGQIDFAQRVLQWPGPQVMVGLGEGATLDNYPGIQETEGWSVFAAEYLYKP